MFHINPFLLFFFFSRKLIYKNSSQIVFTLLFLHFFQFFSVQLYRIVCSRFQSVSKFLPYVVQSWNANDSVFTATEREVFYVSSTFLPNGERKILNSYTHTHPYIRTPKRGSVSVACRPSLSDCDVLKTPRTAKQYGKSYLCMYVYCFFPSLALELRTIIGIRFSTQTQWERESARRRAQCKLCIDTFGELLPQANSIKAFHFSSERDII